MNEKELKRLKADAAKYAPWNIAHFPIQLRRKIVAIANLRGLTIAEALEEIVTDWLGQEKQRKDLKDLLDGS